MTDRTDVPVAIAAARSTLDLTVNFWIPGFVARTVDSAHEALDLTEAGGVVVLDPADPLTESVLRLLHRRQVIRPIVLLADDASDLNGMGPSPQGTIVCTSRQTEALATALATASTPGVEEEEEPSAPVALEPPGRVEINEPPSVGPAEGADAPLPGSEVSDPPAGSMPAPKTDGPPASEVDVGARDPEIDEAVPGVHAPATSADRPRRRDRGRDRSGLLRRLAGRRPDKPDEPAELGGGSTADEDTSLAAGADIDRRAEPETPSGRPRGSAAQEAVVDEVIELEPDARSRVALEPARIARSWQALAAVQASIGSGAAMVALRTSSGSYTVVAGTGIAPLDADQVIPATSPVLDHLRYGSGWWCRPELPQGPAMPLNECETLLAVGVPWGDQALDGIVLIGRREPFGSAEATAVAQTIQQLEPRTIWPIISLEPEASAAPPEPAEDPCGAVPSFAIRSAWRLLHEVYPLLGGAAAVISMRTAAATYASIAAVNVEPKAPATLLGVEDELMMRLRASDGWIAFTAAGDDAQAASRLPVSDLPFMAMIARGDADEPEAIMSLARRRPWPSEDLAQLADVVRSHALWPTAGEHPQAVRSR